ncbi:PAS domain S-box protein [Sulfurimonas aquatica]|uniref:histidine kinase n=1 Tax=Sulfurimonas aquatica TaxID=2672570 RepID=A0A975AY13_9BACT|nr:PAS domain S-box protein [Sulfurimonas aquatica]QSZ40633.1 PAS domain S-box protein [Sulfurimonas aquatica]
MNLNKLKTLSTSIFISFLIISIIPLSIVSWISYSDSVKNIEQLKKNKLENRAAQNVDFITSLFKNTKENLLSWAGYEGTQEFMQKLNSEVFQSKLTAKEFVLSDKYKSMKQIKENTLKQLNESYDYIYDTFLIDTAGNILYTVKRESDLGENLSTGIYSSTLFAQVFRASRRDKKTYFSDIERYTPSGGDIAGFICTPMITNAGKVIGYIAVQIDLASMFNRFRNIKDEESGIKHYLVGSDSLLRTSLNNHDEVLKRAINTEQFWLWYNKYGIEKNKNPKMKEELLSYMGPDGTKVLGLYYPISILGKNWVHISEIDASLFYKDSHELMKNILGLMILTVLLIVVLSLWIAKRITSPIAYLNNQAHRYIKGEKSVSLLLNSKDEIGQLSDTFHTMMKQQQEHEKELERLLESLKFQKFALDVHAIVAITNTQGDILYANKQFEEISGYTQNELLGANHRILNSGHHPLSFWKEMYEEIKNGNIWHGVVKNRAKDGSYYWVDTTVLPFMGSNSKVEQYIAIRTDITHQKEIEKNILENANLQNAMFDNAGISIIITDTQGLIQSFNKEAENLLGYKAEELVGKETLAIFHKVNEIVSMSKQLSKCFGVEIEPGFGVFVEEANRGLASIHEWTYVHKDSSEFPVTIAVTAFYGESNAILGYVGMVHDIRLFKEAQQKIIDAKDAAESSERAKSEFLASMSHELRTPLTAILGFTNILESKVTDETHLSYAKHIASSSQQLLTLVNDILDISKIQSGKFRISPYSFHAHSEFTKLSLGLESLVEKKKLHFEKDFDESIKLVLYGDLTRINQVITNLLSNAIKFTPQKGSIGLAIHYSDGKLIVEVRDTGIGMNEDALSRIFKPFEQADGSTTRKYGGSGLGLTIVQKIIELMDGRLETKSKEGEGTTFKVTLPIPLSDEEIEEDSTEEGNQNSKFQGNILVAEDNKTNQILIRLLLEERGLCCDFADNGQIVVEMYDPRKYDLLFMDENMTLMNGTEAFKIIKNRYKDKCGPIVALTANAISGDREKFISIGMDDYISKPIDEQRLYEVLSRYTTVMKF